METNKQQPNKRYSINESSYYSQIPPSPHLQRISEKRRNSMRTPAYNDSSYGNWVMANSSPVLGKFYPRRLPRKIKMLHEIFRPETGRSRCRPFSSKSITESLAGHLIGGTRGKRNSVPENIPNSVTENVTKSYRFITSIEERNKETVVKPSATSMKRAIFLQKRKLTDVVKSKSRGADQTKIKQKDESYYASETAHKVLKTIIKRYKITHSEKAEAEPASPNISTATPQLPASPNKKFKNNPIFKLIQNYKPSKQHSLSSKRISRCTNCSSSMLQVDYEAEELKRIRNLRKTRMKNIYEDVLYKAGEGSARYLYNDYFNDANKIVKVKELESAMEAKLRGQEQVAKIISSKKIKVSRNANIKRCPTASQKRARIKSYGRWYLPPSKFNSALQVPDSPL